ncbi:hypothetical protein EON64_03565 [archaeon]|nr:MAG: hypothetical protein EON64_03565 [archaeon]
MPHTVTNKHRPHRADTRGSAKQRIKVMRAAQDNSKIQDLRVTRIPKKEQKEREGNEAPLSTLTKEEKQLRGLKKKLKSINDLIERKEKGEVLNEAQSGKVKLLDEVLEAIQSLVGAAK